MSHLGKMVSKDLVIGLQNNKICSTYKNGKQVKNYFKAKNIVSIQKPLELIHMDYFFKTKSIRKISHALVLVMIFLDLLGLCFLLHKMKLSKPLKSFPRSYKMKKKDLKIKSLRSDHGEDFQNESFDNFCEENDITHNFSAAKTPQQNGVVERKNNFLKQLTRIMFNESNLPKYFWIDVVSTACYVSNKILIRPVLKLTP